MCSFPTLLSLCEYQASRKSLVKITSLVHNCRMVKVYTMDELVHVLRNFGIVVSNLNRPFMFFLPCFQGSASLSIVYEIAINSILCLLYYLQFKLLYLFIYLIEIYVI